jgi:hypothetical protein
MGKFKKKKKVLSFAFASQSIHCLCYFYFFATQLLGELRFGGIIFDPLVEFSLVKQVTC